MPSYAPETLIVEDIDAYLDQQARKSMLRFITCGSVDDGKSTLIGRLLYDSRTIFADQLATLEEDSRRIGTQGGAIDFALLVDGLSAEREQGITIDVAYRFFSTPRRKFIVADTPGHEQYTRNMVTGASTADLAVILIDARRGVLSQTRRHSYLVQLMGIRHVVLAVNKMDLVQYDQAVFNKIVADYQCFAKDIGIEHITSIPVSGLTGANVTTRSPDMPWYDGPALLEYLETVEIADHALDQSFRMPVQWVNRPDLDFRGFAGMITSGSVRKGDAVRIMPSGRTTHIARMIIGDTDRNNGEAGQSVTLAFTDEVDCSRGDVVASTDSLPSVGDAIEATLVWMDHADLIPGHGYLMKLATQTAGATVRTPRAVIDIDTGIQHPASTLSLNDIGVAELQLDHTIVFSTYDDNHILGSFVLVDRATNATVAAGMIRRGLTRASNIQWQSTTITRETHASQKGQKARLLWFTGLSGSGKSTIANMVERRLHALGKHSFLLDGDNLRHGLNRDLGFDQSDRIENIRRVGEVARLMTDAGLIVLAAFISPYSADRAMVREMMTPGEFVEIFVDTPLEEAEKRDVKGLYAKARAGIIENFTGISSPYEPPVDPEMRIDTTRERAEDAANRIVEYVLGIWAPTL